MTEPLHPGSLVKEETAHWEREKRQASQDEKKQKEPGTDVIASLHRRLHSNLHW